MNPTHYDRSRLRFAALASVTLTAAAMRLLPHPANVTPIAAMALFGGAHFRSARAAFGVPLAAMLLSDVMLALTLYGSAALRGVPFVYTAFALTVLLGRFMCARSSAPRVASAAIGASLLFYVVADFGVWLRGDLYPRTFEGLWACYVAALPYLRNTVLGNLAFTTLLFGGMALARRRVPLLREVAGPGTARA